MSDEPAGLFMFLMIMFDLGNEIIFGFRMFGVLLMFIICGILAVCDETSLRTVEFAFVFI
jgi:hypothetical protein